MIARGFKSVIWVATVGAAALGCYMVSLRVATERNELAKVELQIVEARREIRSLQTELGTRGRMTQLEQWNAEVLALAAPSSAQFLKDEFTLARLYRNDPTVADRSAEVRLASADQDPAKPVEAAKPAAPAIVRALAEPAAAPPPLIHRASFAPAEPKPAVAKADKPASAPARPTAKPGAQRTASAAPDKPEAATAKPTAKPATPAVKTASLGAKPATKPASSPPKPATKPAATALKPATKPATAAAKPATIAAKPLRDAAGAARQAKGTGGN